MPTRLGMFPHCSGIACHSIWHMMIPYRFYTSFQRLSRRPLVHSTKVDMHGHVAAPQRVWEARGMYLSAIGFAMTWDSHQSGVSLPRMDVSPCNLSRYRHHSSGILHSIAIGSWIEFLSAIHNKIRKFVIWRIVHADQIIWQCWQRKCGRKCKRERGRSCERKQKASARLMSLTYSTQWPVIQHMSHHIQTPPSIWYMIWGQSSRLHMPYSMHDHTSHEMYNNLYHHSDVTWLCSIHCMVHFHRSIVLCTPGATGKGHPTSYTKPRVARKHQELSSSHEKMSTIFIMIALLDTHSYCSCRCFHCNLQIEGFPTICNMQNLDNSAESYESSKKCCKVPSRLANANAIANAIRYANACNLCERCGRWPLTVQCDLIKH